MSEKPKAKVLTRQEELMRGFHFNQAALEANRRGYITEQQRKWVLKREQWNLWLILLFLFGLGAAGCLLTLIVGLFTAYTNSDSVFATMLFSAFVIMIFPFVITLIFYLPKYQVYQELKAGEVLAIQGLTVVNLNEKRPSSLIVNKLQLKAPRVGLMRVKHLEPHIVYYLPRSKVVVSVETVEE